MYYIFGQFADFYVCRILATATKLQVFNPGQAASASSLFSELAAGRLS
jgi:hypothetical protein